MSDKSYLLAIPAFNEGRFVVRMVREAKQYLPNVLVVDDGSSDATPDHLRALSGIHVIRHDRNLGYGRSLADAFAFAIREQYDWIVTMDCDEQHEPSAIPMFVEHADRDEADIISGSRYMAEPEEPLAAPADRRRINQRITRMLNERLGLALTDAFCGFKAYRTAALRRLAITEPGYAMPLQLWVQAVRAGLRIVEVPVRLIYNDPMRQFGGGLDDPQARYAHYLEVFNAAIAAAETAAPIATSSPCH
jgi:dolichol-phosphate mannosyltransferase